MAPLLKNFKFTIKYITNKSHVFNPFLAPILLWKFMFKNLLKLLCKGVCRFQFGKITNFCKILSQIHFYSYTILISFQFLESLGFCVMC
jgi:hypothetical protein